MSAQSAGSLSVKAARVLTRKKKTTAGSAVQRDRPRPYRLRFKTYEQKK